MPDARGLFFFDGCFLSDSKSNKSFKIYTADALKLKDKKAIMAHMDRDHIYEVEDEFLDKMKELGATLQSTESY